MVGPQLQFNERILPENMKRPESPQLSSKLTTGWALALSGVRVLLTALEGHYRSQRDHPWLSVIEDISNLLLFVQSSLS